MLDVDALGGMVEVFIATIVANVIAGMIANVLTPASSGGVVGNYADIYASLQSAVAEMTAAGTSMTAASASVVAGGVALDGLPAAIWSDILYPWSISQVVKFERSLYRVMSALNTQALQAPSPGFVLLGDMTYDVTAPFNTPPGPAPVLHLGLRVGTIPESGVDSRPYDEDQTLSYLDQIAAWNPGFTWAINAAGLAQASDPVNGSFSWVCALNAGVFEWVRRYHYAPDGSAVLHERRSWASDVADNLGAIPVVWRPDVP